MALLASGKVVGVLIEGESTWHAPHAGPGDYNTLCGIDADDPSIGHQGVIETPPGQKITCAQCKLIWEGVRALRLTSRHFA
jgi:hypothetical protein